MHHLLQLFDLLVELYNDTSLSSKRKSFLYVIFCLMTKVMFIIFSISRGLEFWSVNHTSIYESSKLKVSKIIKFLGEASHN